jgi:hypothetical protein
VNCGHSAARRSRPRCAGTAEDRLNDPFAYEDEEDEEPS